ncbi:MAG: hypothetical protein AAFY26_06905 [Cyanobacteria bacterium J06638_22]
MTSANLTYNNWNAPLYPLQRAQENPQVLNENQPDVRIRRTKTGWQVTDVMRNETRNFNSEADIRSWLDNRF